MEEWENVMNCEDESMFGDCVNHFEYTCRSCPLLFEYVNNTWIIPYNTYFVKAWTNKVMHLGNTTTNRVEFAHWNLKKVLGNSMGDLCSCWDAIHNVIVLQHNKIKASFEISLNLMSEAYIGIKYKKLVGRVSIYALGLIAKELERVNLVGLDTGRCGCILRRTYGVPCACELARYGPGMIPLREFHVMWTRLSISDIVSNESQPELSIQHELTMVEEKFKEVEIGGKVTIKQKLLDIVCPAMTSMIPPLHKVKTKGAQKKKLQRTERSTKRDPSYFEHVDTFQSTIESSSAKNKLQLKDKPRQRRRVPMINQFHPICQPYILNIVDVVADGHCGYRCIASSLGLGEDSWPTIRNDLYKELSQWRDEYATLVGGYDRLEQLRRSLMVDPQSAANATKWMTILDIGYAIVNRYNIILVCLSHTQNYTIFPLRTRPPSDVQLQDGCPLPMTDVICSTNCYPEARMWSYSYTNRMQAFSELMGVTTSYVDITDS
ncbi:uncharacterized protein LOC128195308 [Vigna angularis]|uniref:uncharacterized protein LOC128195308 n=1 Tax=Phaseolus angularis TaxID=3914 RepID=UPI0022B3FD5B|nr:uncharacterized protein LOC128195308 [Vigna angularis]